ncbi:MFS transporter [Pseudolabrys taiwanensis]|uniref:MFS transporter n=1 Tax=Pseudolabrys taiwanensis TaxID=331696 RepID=A0A346A0W5_9HYPH|nr:MFS transporter [Pseudolabrys taiwanensis]AXK82812.1 MFS transporter [Pseudolabrys taiwanensis]
MTATPETAAPATTPTFLETVAVYFKPRVLIVLFLGFSAGLPLALSGSTLLFWAAEVGVNLKTIGLFALVGTPYTIKFLWAPIVDALDVPILARWLGRRRAWLLLTQLLLMVAILFLGANDPATAPAVVALGALMVATASATQDIVIDAFRIESLDENEQAAGMASYVAAYRVGMLASSAGALYVVSGFEALGFTKSGAWSAGYAAMAALVLVGMLTTLVATEPEKSAKAEAIHGRETPVARLKRTISGAFVDFFTYDGVLVAIVVLVFVVLFKFTDALAGVMTGPFAVDLGFSRTEYANIVKGVGLIALLAGGFAGGYIARALPLAASLWIGGILQSVANLAFSWLAVMGHDLMWLTVAITVENFTSAIGTVMFVAYLSALCRNPLHTATQYALLTALAAVGRTYLSAGAGYVADATGWMWFFVICALAGLPSLLLLWWLQTKGHFAKLAPKKS